MTTPTPLPCPFCGAVAMVIDRGHSIVVECLGCNVLGPMSKGYDDAVAAWNKAPREAQPDHLAERLRNARRRGRRVLARRRSR